MAYRAPAFPFSSAPKHSLTFKRRRRRRGRVSRLDNCATVAAGRPARLGPRTAIPHSQPPYPIPPLPPSRPSPTPPPHSCCLARRRLRSLGAGPGRPGAVCGPTRGRARRRALPAGHIRTLVCKQDCSQNSQPKQRAAAARFSAAAGFQLDSLFSIVDNIVLISK